MILTTNIGRYGPQLGVKGKILLPIVLLGICLTLGAGWYITRNSSAQAIQATRDKAQGLANQIRELRGYYTQNVVLRVKPYNIAITHDYAEQQAAIPLPATMVHELTEILSQKERVYHPTIQRASLPLPQGWWSARCL